MIKTKDTYRNYEFVITEHHSQMEMIEHWFCGYIVLHPFDDLFDVEESLQDSASSFLEEPTFTGEMNIVDDDVVLESLDLYDSHSIQEKDKRYVIGFDTMHSEYENIELNEYIDVMKELIDSMINEHEK